MRWRSAGGSEHRCKDASTSFLGIRGHPRMVLQAAGGGGAAQGEGVVLRAPGGPDDAHGEPRAAATVHLHGAGQGLDPAPLRSLLRAHARRHGAPPPHPPVRAPLPAASLSEVTRTQATFVCQPSESLRIEGAPSQSLCWSIVWVCCSALSALGPRWQDQGRRGAAATVRVGGGVADDGGGEVQALQVALHHRHAVRVEVEGGLPVPHRCRGARRARRCTGPGGASFRHCPTPRVLPSQSRPVPHHSRPT